ncbi:MAG: DUF1786 domain-containing protein [Desulfovibrionaceae bacterium]
MHRNILCLDIGSGTQDVLYFMPDRELENCPKFVLPAPARYVGKRIQELTKAGRHIFLHGSNMGGGFFRALQAHMQAGFKVATHPVAALAIADDITRLEAQGIALAERAPDGYCPVHLADYEPGFWRALLGAAGLPYPDLVLAAVQDHGFHPGRSNRVGRFKLWEGFLRETDGRVEQLLFASPPAALTRLATLAVSTGGPVADTGAAAVLGALFMPDIRARNRDKGILVVNVGNSHVVAFLVRDDRILGVYEQHTGAMTGQRLRHDLEAFRQGRLTCDVVLNEGGHGCLVLDAAQAGRDADAFAPVFILGPQRKMLEGYGAFPAPGGDMMLAGCFGLLQGIMMQQAQ